MTHLYQRIAQHVDAWRADDHPSEEFPAIGEILGWARVPESGSLRFLRLPQLKALETYWYLRLVQETPHVFDLYERLFPPDNDLPGLLEALGVPDPAFKTSNYSTEALWQRIKTDDGFVRQFRLQALRETITLSYPSYILALAMGAGKTILIGAIVATEFAMALEYPDGPFIQNALVFAPGKTIIESLRELAEVPYDRLLPPRMYKAFAASVKLTFTRDGEKDIPVIRRSAFNVIVTNTEKIRIQKETIRRSDLGALLTPEREDEARTEVANLRLQAIASLPHLAVFSDEAHHTYGQSLDTELKKVRKTVDYLAEKTNVICVVNTTGTPYFMRQPLKDVVIWYGLSEGIHDGILKDLSDNIQAYDFAGDARAYVAHVVEDFFRDYGDVQLPNGAPAKLAVYFPQTSDLRELRPEIDRTLAKIGLSPALCLVNTSDETLTKRADIDAFNRLNDPAAPHRVILLVNKGTEGWNCPSLFACALARRLKTSNNFVLQAATRCLRQVPGNTAKARVYLSRDNFSILDRQLQETFGETIQDLNRTARESAHRQIVLRKLNLPPLVMTRLVRSVVRHHGDGRSLRLERPQGAAGSTLTKAPFSVEVQEATRRVLRQIGESVTIETEPDVMDVYATAVTLAVRYGVDLWAIYDELRRLYVADDIPVAHLNELARQTEEQTRHYEVKEETVEVALALVKPDGFIREPDPSGTNVYMAEITYPVDRERLLLWPEQIQENREGYGFHYAPYNFDSNPELSFYEQILRQLAIDPGEIEDVYFTGAITDPAKTEFFVEYRDTEGKYRRYAPDFVIRKKPPEGGRPGTGKVLIVEIKSERERAHPVEGETGLKAIAVRKWAHLNPNRVKYEMIFTGSDIVTPDQMRGARSFVRESTTASRIAIDRPKIADFCRRHHIRKLALFGSVLRDDFGPDSDIDVLVEFEPGHVPGLAFLAMEAELSEILGRKVDLNTPGFLNVHLRDRVLTEAEIQYVQT